MTPLLIVVPAIAAAAISYVLSPLVRILSIRIGAIDKPGPRKIHHAPVPRAGGLAVLGASAIVAAATRGVLSHVGTRLPVDLWLGVGVGILPVIAVSIWDDIRGLRARQKLVAHVVGAAVAVGCGISLASEVHVFGHTIAIGLFAAPLSVLWIVGVTNAFNIVDGLDGLSAGLGFISSLSLAGVFVLVGETGLASAVLVVAGALAGFLPFNTYPARMFLGDTGATGIGFGLATLALMGGSRLSAGFAVLLPVFVLGLPIADTLISMVRRMLRRLEEHTAGGVLEPDSNHVHHRLLALGIDHRRAVFILYGAGLLLASGALLSLLMTTVQAALLAMALLIAGFVGIAKLGYDEFAVIRNGAVLRLYDVPVLKASMFVVFVDLLMVAVGVYVAVALKTEDWTLVVFRDTAIWMTAALAPITAGVFAWFHIYRGSWRIADARDFARACSAVMVAAVIGLAGALLFARGAAATTISLFAIYGLVSIVFVTASRASYQLLVAMRNVRARVPATTPGTGFTRTASPDPAAAMVMSAVMIQECQSCGSRTLHRSRATNLLERVRRRFSHKRLFRCTACGWRGWEEPLDFSASVTSVIPSQPSPLFHSLDILLAKDARQ